MRGTDYWEAEVPKASEGKRSFMGRVRNCNVMNAQESFNCIGVHVAEINCSHLLSQVFL